MLNFIHQKYVDTLY